MRIFTFRKSGGTFFLFAFILMSVTYSYGQTCPAVGDQNPDQSGNQQYFCDTTSTEVQDLSADAGAVWYENQTTTTALLPTQLLNSGSTYYAGSSDGSCAGIRTPVTVTIFSQPNILGIYENKSRSSKQSIPSLTFCVGDIENSGVFLSNIRTSADGGNIQWYDSQRGGAVLPSTTELDDGKTYWVDQGSPYVSCRSTRRSVTIVLYSEPAPTGESAQTFCASTNPTLSDIVASGEDNRYFTSETSSSELSASTPLVNGSTYFVANQGDNCLSEARLAVTVTVNDLTILESTQGFCDSDNPTVADLVPADGVWYADTTFSTPLAPDVALVHTNTYYLQYDEGACTTQGVTADIFQAPNAGTPTAVTFCSNDAAFDLFEQIEGTPDPGGSFNPVLTNNIFDPATFGPGTHTFIYTVPGNDFCADSQNTISVTVLEAPVAGGDVTQTSCTADFPDGDALMTAFNGFLEGRDASGTFNPSLESLRDAYNTNPVGVFSTVYTVTGSNGSCSDSANFEITVNQTPEAGEDAVVQLIEGDNTVIDLFAAINGTPETGGTWNKGDGTFDPAVDTAPFTYTYTVTSNGCSDITVVFVAEACPIVSDTTPEFCETVDDGTGPDFPRVEDLLPAHAVWYTSADYNDDTRIPLDTQLVDGGVYYAGNESGTCTARTAVTVTILDSPNAGIDTQATVCFNDAPFDLTTLISPSILGQADANGTFSPALASGGTTFDPAVDAGQTYTYTVTSTTTCADASAEITVTVAAVPDAPVTTDLTDCASSRLTFADLTVTIDPGNTVQWYSDQTLSTPVEATTLLSTGTFYATQTSTVGCESAASAAVVVINDAPTPSLVTNGNVFCLADEPTLGEIAMNESGITWYDSATGGNVLSPNITLVHGTIYYASLTDAASGCESSQRLAVPAVLEHCPLPVPEGFSPNGDGINDTFVVDFMVQQYPDFTIEIFNRWGQIVFEGDASNFAWDGTSNKGALGSDVVPVGVYFYVIEYNDGVTAPTQGTIYLSR